MAIVLVLALLVPGILSQCTLEKAGPFFRKSVYKFSLELVERVAHETDNHFVTSALSPWTLLSTVSLGATEETLAELNRVLKLHPHKCFNGKYFELIRQITGQYSGTVLERSSSLFADSRFPLLPKFVTRVNNTQVCTIKTIEFDNLDNTARTINEFVKQATHGMIDEMVQANDLEGAYMVIVDALYFKGSWKTQFSSADTEISAFYDETGNQLGDVNLMFSRQSANVAQITQIGATVLELPYSGSERFSMLFILPDFGRTVTSVISDLKTISITSILTLFDKYDQQEVLIQIPRFKIDSDLDNLKELLADMGLKTLFDSSRAKLGDMTNYQLFVSNLIQKASVEVTEEGTEAAAASEAVLFGRSGGGFMTEQFVANRPFLFMIIDKTLEVAVFTGVYSKPSVY